jgi:hypothetical protein
MDLDCNSLATVSDIADACIQHQGQDLENDTSVGSKKIHYLEHTSDFMEVGTKLAKSAEIPISIPATGFGMGPASSQTFNRVGVGNSWKAWLG